MLILCQNKIAILNYSAITTIIADNNELIARLINGHIATLGKYNTEIRAKEVLQEIIKVYKESGKKQIDDFIIETNVVYEMPKD